MLRGVYTRYKEPSLKPTVSLYIATSLDGFIARKNGGLDWLGNEHDQGNEDYGYNEFMNSVDVVIMGRKTFEKVLTFGELPFKDKKVVVLSSGAPAIPESLHDKVTVLSADPKDIVELFSAQGTTHLYVDGGITIQRFIAAGLVDEMTITRVPVLLGDGISLFGPLDRDARLIHLATRQFENGYVQSKYRFVKNTYYTIPEYRSA